MKNNKAQAMGIGVIMIVFIAVLVGVILFQSAAQAVGTVTNTEALVNYTATAAANEESFYLTNYRAIDVSSITNGTTGAVIGAGNYTVTNNVVYNGALSTQITVNAATYAEETWAINGVAQPLTYVDNAGGRSMVSLITIFFALGVALIALYPVYSSKLLEMIGK
jgi:hypothetical protein